MNKSEIITWVAALPENDPNLIAIGKIHRGEKTPVAAQGVGRTYSITETGRLAGISRQSVHTALRAGVLRASPLYPGGRRRVREADLRQWLEGRAA